MKNIFKSFFILVLITGLFSSCEDIEKSPIVRQSVAPFVNIKITNTTYDLSDLSSAFTGKLYTNVPEDVQSYTLKVGLNDNSNSVEYVDWITVTPSDLPKDISLSLQQLLDLLGKDASVLNAGQTVEFRGVSTGVNGVVIDRNNSTDIPNTGLNDPGMRQAYNFSGIILCPAFQASDLVGTWNVDALGFAGFFGESQATREVIAGPGENQVTIVGGEYPTAGGAQDDLIITFNPTTGAVTGVNEDGVAFGPGNSRNLPTNTYLLAPDGVVLPCVNKMLLRLNFSPYSGNAHSFNLSR